MPFDEFYTQKISNKMLNDYLVNRLSLSSLAESVSDIGFVLNASLNLNIILR